MRVKVLLGIAMGIGLMVGGAWFERKGIVSRHWPTVDGTVVTSRLVSRRGWHADVRYEYSVAGILHRNNSVSLDVFSTARGEVARYEVGRHVAVHYDPADPGSSILEPGGHGGLVGLLGGLFVVAYWARKYRG